MSPQEIMTVAAEFKVRGMFPYGERVFWINDEADEQIGSIILSEKLQKQSGTLVMVGVDVDVAKYRARVGDRVLYIKYRPAEMQLPRLDGSMVAVLSAHISDLYVGEDVPELRKLFEEEVQRLKPDLILPGSAYAVDQV